MNIKNIMNVEMFLYMRTRFKMPVKFNFKAAAVTALGKFEVYDL